MGGEEHETPQYKHDSYIINSLVKAVFHGTNYICTCILLHTQAHSHFIPHKLMRVNCMHYSEYIISLFYFDMVAFTSSFGAFR